MEGLACKRDSLKRRSTARWERASSSRSTRASRLWATLRLRVTVSASVGSSCWLMVVRFSCSSFCCSEVIGSLLGMQEESVVVGQRQRIGGQFVELRVLETERGLHVTRPLLLALVREYGPDAVAAALSKAHAASAFGADYIANILRQQQRPRDESAGGMSFAQ